MKKNLIVPFLRSRIGQKLLLKMKLTLIILVGCLMQVSASVYSQATKFSLNIHNKQVVDVLKEIEEKSDFRFFYQREQVDVTRKVDLKVREITVEAILDQLFRDQEVSFNVTDDNLIIIRPEIEKTMMVGSFEQQKSISGKVTDTSGASLPGVSVIIKGTTTGTITDFNGNYTLTNIPDNAVVLFSFVGMKGQQVKVDKQKVINIVLEEESIGIEEVVAVGYGTQRRGNITGSIASVKSKDLTIAPVASTTNALAGRLPGLISTQTSGQPGADAAKLSIRGYGDALIIVDGIEADFNTIDANQIESISILKDGSASIYGARAGNGVILVTTKRGTVGKPTITLNSSYTLQGITIMPKPVSAGQYAQMARETWLQAGKPEAQVPFSEEQVQKYYDGTDPLFPNTNWYDELIRPYAPQQQHNLSIRGGSDRIKYYGFLGFLDQETIFKNNGGNYKRYNFQSNMDAQVLDNLNFQLTIASTVEDRNFPQASLGSGEASVWGYFWNTLPIYPAHLPDPTKVPFAFGAGTGGAHVTSNRELSGYNDTDGQNIKGSMALNYTFKFIKGLSARAFANYDRNYIANKVFVKPVELYTYDPASEIYTLAGAYNSDISLSMRNDKGRTLTGQLSLNFDRTFANNHHVTALALYEAIDYQGDWISAYRKGYITTSIDQMYAGNTIGMSNNGSANETGRTSYVGRLNYSFRNKYLIESILRADATAKFPSDTRWGYFPSVSLGWRIAEENFLKDRSAFDELKLRASYGEAGNDNIGNFQYLSGYEFNGNSYILGNGPQKGLVSKGLPNPYLTWEQIKTYNLGLDYSLFDRKIYGEAEVFYRDRSGIMTNRLATVPSTFGSALPPENINSTTDRGFEAVLGTAGKAGKFEWDISGNISWSRAKWNYFEEPAYTDSDQVRMDLRSNQWMDRHFGYISAGVFTTQEEIDALTYDHDLQGNITLRPGDIHYLDMNNDGKLDWRDRTEIGKGTTPHWMLGFNTNLRYGNFDLSALFQGAFGYYKYLTFSQGQMYPSFVFDGRWTPENNNSDVIIPRLGGTGPNSYDSDFNYKKAGYLRLKVLSVGYNIPKRWLDQANISQVRFYFSGTNLLTFDKLKKYDLDPEAPTKESGRYYPQQRTISFGAIISL